MIKLGDCDNCKHRFGFKKGHTLCDAFPDGVPYEHTEKDVKSLKECNNGISYETKEINEEQYLLCDDTAEHWLITHANECAEFEEMLKRIKSQKEFKRKDKS